MVRRSLDGLYALLRAASDRPLSEHEAIEHLCHRNCDLSDVLLRALEGKNPFAAAAKQPQHAAHVAFLSSLTPEKLGYLRSLLYPEGSSDRTLFSCADVQQITATLRGESSPPGRPRRPCRSGRRPSPIGSASSAERSTSCFAAARYATPRSRDTSWTLSAA